MYESLIMNIVATARLDEKGYLMPLERWDRNVGRLLARDVVPEGLTEDHWKIVEYLRQYYLEFGIVPKPKLPADGRRGRVVDEVEMSVVELNRSSAASRSVALILPRSTDLPKKPAVCLLARCSGSALVS